MASILVLGYRQGLDDAIRRRGLESFFVVERVKRELAGRAYVRVSGLEDAQEVLRAVQARAPRDLAGVVTGHEEAVFTAALLRDVFGLPGDRQAARTLRFRDKYLQKRALPASVPRAECEYITCDSSFDEIAARLGAPFVVKTANGFGANRTYLVRSPEQLAAYWNEDATESDVGVVAESFVRGDEVHVDGLWVRGRLLWSCMSRFVDPPMQWNEGAILADSLISRHHEPDLCAEGDALTEQALRGLDAPDCVFHLEAFRGATGPDASGLVFGECAIRIAGAMIPEVVSLTYAVDLYDLALSLALGEPVEPPNALDPPDYYYGYVFLRRVPGVHVSEGDFRRAIPELYEIDYPADPDARIGAYGRVGHALVRHEDSIRLHQLVAEVAALNLTGSVSGRDLVSDHG